MPEPGNSTDACAREEYEALLAIQVAAANFITNAIDASEDVTREGRMRLFEALTDYEVLRAPH